MLVRLKMNAVEIIRFQEDREAQGKEIEEKNYKQMVETYFDEVSGNKMTAFNFSKEIFKAMQNLKYAFPFSPTKKHKTVSDFKIIEKAIKGLVNLLNLQMIKKGWKPGKHINIYSHYK